MKNLFEAAMVEEVKQRLNAAQAVAHCSAGLELAVGDKIPQRLLLGRLTKPVSVNVRHRSALCCRSRRHCES